MILREKFERILGRMDIDRPIRLVYIGNPSLGVTYDHNNWKDLVIVSIKDSDINFEGKFGEYSTKKIEMVEHTHSPLEYSYKMLYETFVANNPCNILSFFMFGHHVDILDSYDNALQFYYSEGENPFEYTFL